MSIGLVLFALMLCSVSAAQPVLLGEMTQGSLIRGKIAPQSQVKLNSQTIKVAPNGEFVFGFGRDANLKHKLSWKLPSANQWESISLQLSKRSYKLDKIEGVEQKYVSPPQSVLARIRQDNSEIAAARRSFTESLAFTEDFILPAQGRISGVYGSQRIFNGRAKRPHFGLDIANKTGTVVIAPASGVVRLVNNDMYYSGGTLILDHGYGISSTFIHLSAIHVTQGQQVNQGEAIAEIGATGRVTGPHLDWRINWFKERLDPALLVELPD